MEGKKSAKSMICKNMMLPNLRVMQTQRMGKFKTTKTCWELLPLLVSPPKFKMLSCLENED